MRTSQWGFFLFLLTFSCGVLAQVSFVEVTGQAGIESPLTWKYGGPALADLNNDGRQDLVLGNHHIVPAQLFLSTEGGVFREGEPVMGGDVHGIAAGDYDGDGRVDLIVSVGGGNGTNPQPPRLLKNTGNGFKDQTEVAGIANMGARGRSVRWLDPDLDGDLDLLQINAVQLPGEMGPRNIMFENIGNGRFTYRPSHAFESVEAERVLVTDLNGDRIPDLVTFTPLHILIGNTDFQFTDVCPQWLGGLTDEQRQHAMAVSEADIDNDGDMDLYVARGKTYYETANNSLQFDAGSGRMDLRDQGSKGQDAVTFMAGETVGLQDFWHWPRGIDLELPVYLGAQQTRLATPVEAITVNAAQAAGMPETLENDGWYLGYLGEGEWQLAWNLSGDLAWGLRASVTGVSEVRPQWEPQELDVQDLLLINQGDRFVDASNLLPEVAGDNNWGVITGDFNNDTRADFFVYRFGRLHGRVEDLMLINESQGDDLRFSASLDHGANNLEEDSHGDMGAPLDYDGDGWLDILSGNDDQGSWHLYRNTAYASGNKNRSMTVHVGYSPLGADPHGAEVSLRSGENAQFQRVGSFGAVHSQSLNNFVHFGLGNSVEMVTVKVRWRDGSEQVRENLQAGSAYEFGQLTLNP